MKPNLQLFGLNLMEQVLTIEGWSKGNATEQAAVDAGKQISAKVNFAEAQLKTDFDL